VTSIQLVGAERQAVWASANEQLAIIAQEKGVSSSEYQQALATAAADFAKFVHQGP
jgi:hypothetical protein